MRAVSTLASVLAGLLFLPSCSGRFGAEARGGSATVVVRGSDTMIVLAQRWAEAYPRASPGVAVQVSGGGSGTGLAALENGTTDIAMASREITAEERARIERARGPVVEERVCLDAIAVYVHPENPVRSLGLDDLAAIYRGRVRRWSEVGGDDAPIVVYSRENSSGTYAFFKERVLARQDFAAEAQTLPGTAAVLHAVAHDRNGIGYGGASRSRGVRIVPLRGSAGEPVLPTAATAADGSYPLARPLYVYRVAGRSPEAERFAEWLRGSDARALATGAGFYPLVEAP
jgi:phosphate transport system substrate-binding protein